MIKNVLCLAGLVLGLQTAWGFALLGPNSQLKAGSGDAWQVTALGYDLTEYLGVGDPGGPVWLGDIGGPKNLGEGYRRNVPVLYYAYDDSFASVASPTESYFGQEGENAVDQAFAIMNTLTNLDALDITQFPFQSQSVNYRAQNLYLTDLKSAMLHLLVEELGLTEPERYTWTLHDIHTESTPAPCPENHDYLVVQRNFDPLPSPLSQVQYSPYVNNVLYTYFINDSCGTIPGIPWTAITVPHGQDPYATLFTSVAANNDAGLEVQDYSIDTITTNILIYRGGLQVGGFYTGLTYDDVGGLKYLMSTNNVSYEPPAAGTILIGANTIGVTNLSPQFALVASNYNAFWLAAQTNDPATLSNLFPGLVILNSSYYVTNLATPIVIAYYTNLIGAPAGSPQKLVIRTNGYSYSYPNVYAYTFANLVVTTNGYHTNTSASLVTVTVGPLSGAPAGTPLVTNTTYKTVVLTNVPSGEYFINTNYLCGPPVFLGTLGTNVTAVTNLLFATSNSAGYFTSQSLVVYSTSHVYAVEWPVCTTTTSGGGGTNSPGYFQGIGGVRFVRVPDWQMTTAHNLNPPITNIYTMTLYNRSTSQWETRTFMRVVTQPDIIISAADLANGPAQDVFNGTVTRTYPNGSNPSIPSYEDANPGNGLAGPGIIDGQTIITFNKTGPVYWNGPFPDTNGFVDAVSEATQVPALQWASFDNSTNAPTLYPNGTSIQELENQMIISILPASLPDGTNGAPYSTTALSATGGQPPYTWTWSGQIPAGLNLSSDGVLDGTPGVVDGNSEPNNPGIYDVAITVTDSSGQISGSPGRVVTLNYTITIH